MTISQRRNVVFLGTSIAFWLPLVLVHPLSPFIPIKHTHYMATNLCFTSGAFNVRCEPGELAPRPGIAAATNFGALIDLRAFYFRFLPPEHI